MISSGNEHKNDFEKFAIISKESIKLYAEMGGFQEMNEDSISVLCQDLNYRIRECIQHAIQFMRHSKRRKLTSEDVNQAFEWSETQPILGYKNNSSDPVKNIFVKEAKVFTFEENKQINLMEEMNKMLNDSCSQFLDVDLHEKQPEVKVEWVSVEGKPNFDVIEANESTTNSNKITHDLMDYFHCVTKAILGTDNKMTDEALIDLSTNNKLVPILPFFINFVNVGVKKLSHDLVQLKKLLQTIDSLLRNRCFYLAIDPYLSLLTKAILYCILEPLGASINPINDHWTIRDFASILLSNLLNIWCDAKIGKEIWLQTIEELRDTLLDFTKPLSSHYGAIVAFHALGHDVIMQHLYPCLSVYLPHLLPFLNKSEYSFAQRKCDAFKVFGSIQSVAEKILLTFRTLLINNLEDVENSHKTHSEPNVENSYQTHSDLNLENSFQVYYELNELFGDSISAKLPTDFPATDFQRLRKHYDKSARVTNYFMSQESTQTGEELLDTFYQTTSRPDDELISVMSTGGEDDNNSYDDNSGGSDNDKETATSDLQIKSTISDSGLGIKLTIKKLRRDEQQNKINVNSNDNNDHSFKGRRVSLKLNREQAFDSVFTIQKPIIFNVRGIHLQNNCYLFLFVFCICSL